MAVFGLVSPSSTDKHEVSDVIVGAEHEWAVQRNPVVPTEATAIAAEQAALIARETLDPAYIAPPKLAIDRETPESRARAQLKASSASILDPLSVKEHGRTFHGLDDGAYYLPNDVEEQHRLDLQHGLWLLLLDNRLNAAPVGEPKNVLDIATGTGIWAIQWARQHPKSNVVGTDLSFIQPTDGPSNCHFVRENSETAEWDFPYKFDYIHMRMVVTCFDDPRTVIRKALENLNPGGWIEFADGSFEYASFDGSVENTHLDQWIRMCNEGGRVKGRDLNKVRYYKSWLQEAGFTDVVELRIPVPMGPWAADPRWKKIGSYQLGNFLGAVEGLSTRLLSFLGLSQKEIQLTVDNAIRDVKNPDIHAVWFVNAVYARKPYDWEMA